MGMYDAEAEGKSAIAFIRPSRAQHARLAEWYEAEYESLLRFAYFVAGDPATAEDLVHDAFVRLSGHSARLEELGFPAYARRTIVNLARSGFRRRLAERRALVRAAGRMENAPPPEDPDEVWDALRALSPRQRACIALRYYADQSDREVAETLGVSVGSVKRHTTRAMEHLRRALVQRRGQP